MRSYRIGKTNIGRFACMRDAAVFHFGTEAVVPMGGGAWMSVMTGELIEVQEA